MLSCLPRKKCRPKSDARHVKRVRRALVGTRAEHALAFTVADEDGAIRLVATVRGNAPRAARQIRPHRTRLDANVAGGAAQWSRSEVLFIGWLRTLSRRSAAGSGRTTLPGGLRLDLRRCSGSCDASCRADQRERAQMLQSWGRDLVVQ